VTASFWGMAASAADLKLGARRRQLRSPPFQQTCHLPVSTMLTGKHPGFRRYNANVALAQNLALE
jgi:hypothetical protein